MYVMSNDVSKYCVTLRRTVFHAPLTFTLRINMATTRTDWCKRPDERIQSSGELTDE